MYETALIIIFSAVVGAVLGVAVAAALLRSRLRAELERDRAKFEDSKKELSYALNSELGKIRESIIASVHAYEHAAKIVEEKLPPVGIRHQEIEHLPEPRQLELKDVAPVGNELWGKETILEVANEDDAEQKSRLFSTGGVGI